MGSKVSIITAVYNNCSTVTQAIESVLSQDYPNIEYIVVDGNSTDGTVEIIRRYEGKITKWTSEPDKGIFDAMNKGLAMATGQIIGILNSDDFYQDSQVITRVVEVFEREGSDAIYGDLVYVDPIKTEKIVRYWKAKTYRENSFTLGWMPPHPTFFVKKKVYLQYGLFDTRLPNSSDYELMLRFIHKYKIKIAYIPKILVRMRNGGNSGSSIRKRLIAKQEDYLSWKLNNITPPFYTILLKVASKLVQYVERPILDTKH
jgi:glycosyltransferase involved in cell wall biosynthesis